MDKSVGFLATIVKGFGNIFGEMQKSLKKLESEADEINPAKAKAKPKKERKRKTICKASDQKSLKTNVSARNATTGMKRRPSGYLLYYKEQMSKATGFKNRRKMDGKLLTKLIAKQWKELSQHEKDAYQAKVIAAEKGKYLQSSESCSYRQDYPPDNESFDEGKSSGSDLSFTVRRRQFLLE